MLTGTLGGKMGRNNIGGLELIANKQPRAYEAVVGKGWGNLLEAYYMEIIEDQDVKDDF